MSPTADDSVLSALSRSELLSSITLVRVASRFWNWTICVLLFFSAVTRT